MNFKNLLLLGVLLSGSAFADVRFDNLVAITKGDYVFLKKSVKTASHVTEASEIAAMNEFLDSDCPEIAFELVEGGFLSKKVKAVNVVDANGDVFMSINRKKTKPSLFGYKITSIEEKRTVEKSIETASNGAVTGADYIEYVTLIEERAYGAVPMLARKTCEYYSTNAF